MADITTNSFSAFAKARREKGAERGHQARFALGNSADE
jgi:hypothetical protein